MLKGAKEHYTSVWVSYGFIHFAYLILLLTPFFIRQGTFSVDYSRPLYLISSLYFIITLVVGVIFIVIEPEKSVAAWLTQIGLLGVFAAWFTSNLIANEHTANAIEKHEKEVQYVKTVSAQLKLSLSQMNDSKTKKQVEQLYDYIHSSPTKSSSGVSTIEQDIMDELKYLFTAISQNDNLMAAQSANKILEMAKERNQKLYLLN